MIGDAVSRDDLRQDCFEVLREAALEVVLATGERLHISAGVDTATLRTVLDVLRA